MSSAIATFGFMEPLPEKIREMLQPLVSARIRDGAGEEVGAVAVDAIPQDRLTEVINALRAATGTEPVQSKPIEPGLRAGRSTRPAIFRTTLRVPMRLFDD